MEIGFLLSEPAMAFPAGRLMAVRGGRLSVLAPDGWRPVPGRRPDGARPVSREGAAEWCAREGRDAGVLDVVPGPGDDRG
ncbi:hypothetical protein Amir_0518 [Actinosynnema mirum DSM 43827]|uniref:Uncharacterized protein n=1 Tax=Actinosynnema mirum (strain ATCC 29888 / DSM 43827 / JCM 3225 / NBRC 14064 / NCIMB 13271 / NRRL B-12336 / IMRU 3971 / 101) TaxID=446462 RepID=C6WI34_ACTMD|nr:hypothetical protein Amir_0518 [Actinosynnema mirum DSM 43827]